MRNDGVEIPGLDHRILIDLVAQLSREIEETKVFASHVVFRVRLLFVAGLHVLMDFPTQIKWLEVL